MKQRFFIFSISILLSIVTWAQKYSDFNPQSFTIDVTEMYPLSYEARLALHDFSLTIRNDSAIVRLPYLGQAYIPSFEYDGLHFDHLYKEMKVTKKKNDDSIFLSFYVKHGTIDHLFIITVYPNHKAYINVIPSNSQSCSFGGTWSNDYSSLQLSYIALVLDEPSSNRLKTFAQANMPWVDPTLYCHHMTIAHHTNVNKKLIQWAKRHEGKSYEVTANAYGYSSKAFAVKVDAGKVPSANTITHVTMATNPLNGGRANDSNQISEWQPLSAPIPLSGTVEFVYK